MKISRIIIFVLLFFITGCTGIEDIDMPVKEDSSYIEPVKIVDIFNALKAETKEKIYADNENNALTTNQLKMIGREAYPYDLTDINGKTVNINDYDKCVLEIVASWCEHCQKETKEYLEDIVTMFPEMTFIQYFNEGTVEEIKEFYADLGMAIPKNVIVISRDDDLTAFHNENYLLDYYPTFISYKNGVVTCMIDQEVSFNRFCGFYDLAFDNPLTSEELVTEEGTSIFELDRDIYDVYADLSLENQMKLDNLAVDEYTKELTLTIMSTTLDYYNTLDSYGDTYFHEVDDYTYYIDKDVVLMYLYFEDVEEATRQIKLTNECIDGHSDVEFIIVFIEGNTSSSMVYDSVEEKLHAPIVSILSDIPAGFYGFTVKKFPTAVFVEKSTFTGAYSNVTHVDRFNEAIKMFIGDESIALKRNN